MTTIIEAVYENGVLKPQVTAGLKEHQRYRLVLEEVSSPEMPGDPALAAELARRTTVLPDGRVTVRLGGLFSAAAAALPDDGDPIADVLDEMRRERAERLDALVDEVWNEQVGT